MSGFLVDTNVISELRKRDRADAGVRTWFEEHRGAQVWTSVLVVGELRRGVELLRRRDDRAADTLQEWLDGVVDDYRDRIIPVTMAIAERWATVTVPDPVPIVDGLLAATAIELDLVLVTRNGGDVDRTGVVHIDPFTSGPAPS